MAPRFRSEAKLIRWLPLLALLLADPASAYRRSKTNAGYSLEWGRRCISWHLHEDGSADLPLSQVIEAAQKSFQEWGTVECSDIEFHYQGVTNDHRVGYNPKRANVNLVVFREDPDDWEHPEGVIALTTATFCTDQANVDCPAGRIVDADIELNGAHFKFSNTSNPRFVRFDLRNTMTHEVGHFIGFDHTDEPEATMYSSAPQGERKKANLDSDDVDAICAVYPSLGEPCESFDVTGDHYVDPSVFASPQEDEGCTAVGAFGWWWLLLVGVRRRRERATPLR